MSIEKPVDLSDEERIRRNQVVSALLARLDAHAPGERSHALRVAVYAVATGERLGLPEGDLLNLRYAAELHDIGKLNVNATLLAAPRPLDQEERVAVERHVVEFEPLLADQAWLESALPLIRHHHERWQGNGYPGQLSGESIPIGARIIGAAETLDVMLQGAPWRTAFAEDVARAAVLGLSGTWFDPAVVDALLGVQPLIQPLIR